MQTPSTMNSALTLISFQSLSLNLKQRLPSQRQQISAKWGKRQQCSPKPIQAILGPNATGGLNNAYHGGDTLPSSPLTDVIHEFYSSLNVKDITRLKKLIAPDCVVEDTAYYEPLDAKNTHTYFTRLMKAMGKNAKFAIDEVCQGVGPTVAVMWHLEWHGEIIPFAKGCSFYMCSANGAALLIRKVHIFDESPLKPGKLALEILNLVTNLFDTFPNIAKGFLKDQEALVQFFLRFYKFRVEPFIIPLLAYYTHIPLLAYYTHIPLLQSFKSRAIWPRSRHYHGWKTSALFAPVTKSRDIAPISRKIAPLSRHFRAAATGPSRVMFIFALLAYYTRFWSYVAHGLTMVLNILYNIFKRFL